MQPHFHLEKAIQAASLLLQRSGSRRPMTRLKLMKLLYFAERLQLQKTGFPIIGDEVYAMDHGPVLSTVLDCLRGRGRDARIWQLHMRSSERDVHLLNSPAPDSLSEQEIETLNEVWLAHGHKTGWRLRQESHHLPEYRRYEPPAGRRRLIPFEDILASLGLSPDEIEGIKQDLEDATRMHQLLS